MPADGVEVVKVFGEVAHVGADAFVFADAAGVTGGVDGGGGFNTLDYSAYSAGNIVTVSLGSGVVTGLGSVANIQDIKGGQSTADTLIGPDANAEWHITGLDAGTVLGITFSGFENVTGAANNEDAFIFRPGGSLTGTLDGGAGGLDALAIEDPSSTDPTPKVLTAVVPDATGAGIQAFGDIYAANMDWAPEELAAFVDGSFTVEGEKGGSDPTLEIAVLFGEGTSGTRLPANVIEYRPLEQGDVALLKVQRDVRQGWGDTASIQLFSAPKRQGVEDAQRVLARWLGLDEPVAEA